MEKFNLPDPEETPRNIFIERGRVLFVTHQITHVAMAHPLDGRPITWGPYWNTAMAVGAFSNPPVELGEEESGVWAFIDEDDNLLAIDMPEPAENGVPVEEILSLLRQMINEEDITEIMEKVISMQKNNPSQGIGDGGIKNIGLAHEGDHDGPLPSSDPVDSKTINIKVEKGSTAEDFLSQLFEAAEEAGAATEEFIEIPEISKAPKTRGMWFKRGEK